MKTKLVLIAVACLLLGLTTSVSAQNNIVTAEHANIINSMNQQMQKDFQVRSTTYFLLSGNEMGNVVSGLLRRNDFREGIGISQEQNQIIQERLRSIDYATSPDRSNDPDFTPLLEEERELRRSFSEAVRSNAPFDVLEEIQNNRLEIKMTMAEMQSERRANLFTENLTPEQMKRIQEFHISAMSEANFVFPQMFEALGLSDEQKKQLDEIKKRVVPEFEKHVNRQVEYEGKFREKLNEVLVEKLNAVPDQKERQRLLDDTQRRLRAEMQPEWSEIMESGKGLADTLKIRMFDVLTDEQWARMIDLIDNPPDYVRKVVEEMREQHRIANVNSSSGGWQPGPNSWKPGDPVPEQYRIERNVRSRFPRGK